MYPAILRSSLSAIVATGVFASVSYGESEEADLAQKLQNPVASLISVPFQLNWDTGMGPLDQGEQFKLNLQPVVPIALNEEWNLIVRTIVPYIWQEDVLTGPRPSFPGLPNDTLAGISAEARKDLRRAAEKSFNEAAERRGVDRHQNGLGDITQTFFFAPSKMTESGVTWGFGPAFLFPTATDDVLGAEKWAAGPSLLILRQTHGWTYGVLSNHLWSFAGDDSRRSVNATFVQPFISYTTKSHTSYSLNSEATYDWNESQWTVPLNISVSQLLRIGKEPVNIAFGGRYYAEGPSGAPEWGLRLVVTLLFPEGKHAAPSSDGKHALK